MSNENINELKDDVNIDNNNNNDTTDSYNIDNKPSNNLSKTKSNIMQSLDDIISTVYNEPCVGLYFCQQHIHNTFPVLLSNLDNLHENKLELDIIGKNLDISKIELKEITDLTGDFSFNMLTKISAINYEINKHKSKNIN